MNEGNLLLFFFTSHIHIASRIKARHLKGLYFTFHKNIFICLKIDTVGTKLVTSFELLAGQL